MSGFDPTAGMSEEEKADFLIKLESLKYSFGLEMMEALSNPNVTDVLINPDGKVFVKEAGKAKRRLPKLASPSQRRSILHTLAAMLDTEINEEKPILEGTLPLNGERFEGLFPPVVTQCSLAIRKPAAKVYTLDDYMRAGIMTFKQAQAILEAVRQHKNILVVGGTGSGKTTLLNAISDAISVETPYDRLVTIEDVKELMSSLEDWVPMYSTKRCTMDQCLAATMRYNPDRIGVGEIRHGGPTMTLLKAWNTGHPGGFATVHADGAEEGLYRVNELIREVMPDDRFEMIARAINVVVFIDNRSEDGRKVREVISVKSWDHHDRKFIFDAIG
ncbi:P-type conjugative transfer ATPase TrbB [Chromobacterium vaccinii]|uniref:P-type conjugative transfer ATPase TrbB n=1 Tax=Chromobacterium vaccinii TaxID=1108595 RepID=UPI003C74BC44